MNTSIFSNFLAKRFSLAVATLLLLVIVALSYQPAMHGPFVFDDQINILENPAVKLDNLSGPSLQKSLLSNDSGILKRVLPALSFGINYYQAQGFEKTSVFKFTNLGIHLLNTLLVFGLMMQLATRLLTPSIDAPSQQQKLLLAFFVALLWAVHPLQVSTVAYVVQRMTSMATFFMLIGLNGMVWARNNLAQGHRYALLWLLIALMVGTVLGLMCKENAALLVLYAAAIEFCFYSRQGREKIMYSVYGLLFVIPLIIGTYLFITGKLNILAGYYTRPFTLEQRLLTEARVVWFYLQMLVMPDIRIMGLFHDDLALSKSWLEPVSTVISIVMWGVLLVVAWWCRHKQAVITFAIVWFLAGHSMESTVIPLEIIYEHRNYLPSLGLIILLVTLLIKLPKAIKLPSLLLVTIVLTVLTFQRATYWASEESLFKSLAINHPASPISLYSYAELLNKKKNLPGEAYTYYLKAVTLNQESASLKMQATLAAPITMAVNPLLGTQKLNAQLSRQHLSPWDLTILDDASHCVIDKFTRCLDHLQDVRQWLKAAIDNNLVDQESRRAFVNSLFTIEMQFGFPQDALQTVTKAQTQDPRVFQYYLMKADALNATGQKDAAMTLINTAENLATQYNPQLLGAVYALKNRFLQQR